MSKFNGHEGNPIHSMYDDCIYSESRDCYTRNNKQFNKAVYWQYLLDPSHILHLCFTGQSSNNFYGNMFSNNTEVLLTFLQSQTFWHIKSSTRKTEKFDFDLDSLL